MIYHSALKKLPPSKHEKKQYFIIGKSMAFTMDINKIRKLPAIYNECDVIYSELPFPQGYRIFMERAKVDRYPNYNEFINNIFNLIKSLKIPIILTAPKNAEKILTEFNREIIDQNGDQISLFAKGVEIPNIKKTYILIEWLAKKYNCIGDFACGYGNTARIFNKAGKNFICSDISEEAIGGTRYNILTEY